MPAPRHTTHPRRVAPFAGLTPPFAWKLEREEVGEEMRERELKRNERRRGRERETKLSR
jgi:hypothetical protein